MMNSGQPLALIDDPRLWLKRYVMELSPLTAGNPDFPLPEPYRFEPWHPATLAGHATAKANAFHGSADAALFPVLASYEGCYKLLVDISRHEQFCPAATWLLLESSEPIGTVQGLANPEQRLGAIQNLGVDPRARRRGLGEALLRQCLRGFLAAGMTRVVLEVTEQNVAALRLYRKWGFRCRQTVYKSVQSLTTGKS